ncbi:MAG: oxygen-independent coproporphyrinogen III oxidase [Bdellovibrionales bacterium]|nr:oxygen-independent coproporphyrinogen III oxidase [Bdellovibrionales bacterium]
MEEHDLRYLAERYQGEAPRYTSYPTARELTSDFGIEQWRAALAETVAFDAAPSFAAYVHLPFCQTLCYFCACNKVISRDGNRVDAYLDALEREAGAYRDLLPAIPLEQLHWGGGTPNYLTAAQLERVYRICEATFPHRLENAELSVEIDPRTIQDEQLELVARLGFNRLSLGVQDFDDTVQRAVNRVQPFELVEGIVERARALGFKGINFDLIYGLPEQTPASFDRTLEQVLRLRPDRLALYGYAHVPWANKVQRALERFTIPQPEDRLRLLTKALQVFRDAGYLSIGLDHFALPTDSLAQAHRAGTLHRNFMGYTTQQSSMVLALGMSAISQLPGALAQNERALEDYIEATERTGLAIVRGVRRSEEDRLRAAIIEQLLCYGRIDFAEFKAAWGKDCAKYFARELQALHALEADALLEIDDSHLSVTERGMPFLRQVATVFDSYLTKQEGTKAFSQAV